MLVTFLFINLNISVQSKILGRILEITMIKKTLLISALTFAVSAPALANNFKKAEDAIEYRQSSFSLMYHNFADISAMLRGKKEMNTDVLSVRAQNVAALSKLPLEAFKMKSANGDTEALPAIWENFSDFEGKMKDFENASAKLAQVAQTGNVKAIKKAFGGVGKTCKSCHKAYKKD